MRQYNKSIRGKLFKYFKQRLGIKKSTKGWWRSNCPHCAGSYTFGIHLEQHDTKCFKCDVRMSPVNLLMVMENFQTKNEAWNFLKIQEEFEGYNDTTAYVRPERKEVLLPESFKLVSNVTTSLLGKFAVNYLVKERKLKLSKLSSKGVGYCTSGPYKGYIIFPFYERGQLKFFQGRKFTPFGTKMKNPAEEDFGIGKSELIYNSDALMIYNTIDIVESIINAETLGDNAIAILGKSISPYQFYMIAKSPVKRINIILDPDALDKAVDLALNLCQIKTVRLVILPEGKDVNDIGREETKRLKRESQWLDYGKAFKLKIKYGTATQHTHN